MRLLLDTHIALWAITDDPRLKHEGRALLADPAHDRYVSIVSLWEIGLKRVTQTAGMPLTSERAASIFDEAGLVHVPLQLWHIVAFEAVPILHGDPFDRMLVAQALYEQLRLVTHDKQVARYSDTFILV